MANHGEVVAEGFVCPVCLKTFEDGEGLVKHMPSHDRRDKAASDGNTGSSSSSGRSGGGLFRRLRGHRSNDDAFAAVEVSYEEYRQLEQLDETQELGPVISLTKKFRSCRRGSADRNAIEQTQLISRIRKLVRGPRSNSSMTRKEFEQSIVSWTDGSLVPACPSCGRKFGMFFRQHHCRSCGCIVCDECSLALDPDFAADLIAVPDLAEDGLTEMPSPSRELKRALSSLSEPLRICPYCNAVLQRANQQRLRGLARTEAAPLMRLHGQMTQLINQTRKEMPGFLTEVDSMISMGSVEMYDELQVKRKILAKQLDAIGKIGIAIRNLGMDTGNLSPAREQLQNNMHAACISFVQMNSVKLHVLPKFEVVVERAKELAEQRRERQLEIKRRQQALEKRQLELAKRGGSSGPSRHARSSETGLGSDDDDSSSDEDISTAGHDAKEFLRAHWVQRKALKRQIKEAQKEQRHEDAASIKAQLQEMRSMKKSMLASLQAKHRAELKSDSRSKPSSATHSRRASTGGEDGASNFGHNASPQRAKSKRASVDSAHQISEHPPNSKAFIESQSNAPLSSSTQAEPKIRRGSGQNVGQAPEPRHKAEEIRPSNGQARSGRNQREANQQRQGPTEQSSSRRSSSSASSRRLSPASMPTSHAASRGMSDSSDSTRPASRADEEEDEDLVWSSDSEDEAQGPFMPQSSDKEFKRLLKEQFRVLKTQRKQAKKENRKEDVKILRREMREVKRTAKQLKRKKR